MISEIIFRELRKFQEILLVADLIDMDIMGLIK